MKTKGRVHSSFKIKSRIEWPVWLGISLTLFYVAFIYLYAEPKRSCDAAVWHLEELQVCLDHPKCMLSRRELKDYNRHIKLLKSSCPRKNFE